MATMIKQKSRRSFDLKLSSNGSVAATDQPRQTTCVSHDGRESEPPEQAVQPREAPELAAKCPPEAPDAGKGGVPFDDRQFRHGRSWS